MENKRINQILKVNSKIEYDSKFYGYKYYIQFEPLHEILTNSDNFYNSLEEGMSYEISYIPTNKIVAPNTASIVVDMKYPRVRTLSVEKTYIETYAPSGK